jgi:predicted transcriptional regulator
MAMTLRLSDDETAALREAADREGISMQEVARKAVRQYVENWAAERDSFLADFARDNKVLLDRLGQ